MCASGFHAALYFRSARPIQGRNVDQYETRGKDNYRVQQHRTTAFENLPSEVCFRKINWLPEDLKLEKYKMFPVSA